MESINILKLSLYQIQMFLEVAKNESITLAAGKLHLSQPMLSKNIAAIERELGLILFIREKGRLKLAPAGKLMQRELDAAVELIERAIMRAHVIQTAGNAPLRIGFPDSMYQEKILLPSIADFRKRTDDFRYNVEFYQFRNLPSEVMCGNIDIIFTTLFELDSVADMGMEHKIALRYPLTAYVSQKSPLAGRKSVTTDELRSFRLVMPSLRVVPNYYKNVILKLFGSEKSMPQVGYYASSSDAVAANVVEDNDIFIADCARQVPDFHNLIGVPIEGTESGVVLAWRRGAHPYVDDFAENTISYWSEHAVH